MDDRREITILALVILALFAMADAMTSTDYMHGFVSITLGVMLVMSAITLLHLALALPKEYRVGAWFIPSMALGLGAVYVVIDAYAMPNPPFPVWVALIDFCIFAYALLWMLADDMRSPELKRFVWKFGGSGVVLLGILSLIHNTQLSYIAAFVTSVIALALSPGRNEFFASNRQEF